jgi:hypothetical protein
VSRSQTTEAKVILGGIKTSEEAFRAENDNYNRYGTPTDLANLHLLGPEIARALGGRFNHPLSSTRRPAAGRTVTSSDEVSSDRQRFLASAQRR